MIKIVKVDGNSMSPEFQSGDYMIVLKKPFFRLRLGDNVLFKLGHMETMVKKIVRLESDQVFLEGSHNHSFDSRNFGYVLKKNIIAKVIYHAKKPRT